MVYHAKQIYRQKNIIFRKATFHKLSRDGNLRGKSAREMNIYHKNQNSQKSLCKLCGIYLLSHEYYIFKSIEPLKIDPSLLIMHSHSILFIQNFVFLRLTIYFYKLIIYAVVTAHPKIIRLRLFEWQYIMWIYGHGARQGFIYK